MKNKLMKMRVGKHKYNGFCRVCHGNFKKGEKFIVFEYVDSKGKVFEYKLCVYCYLKFVAKGFGYKKIMDILFKIVEEEI